MLYMCLCKNYSVFLNKINEINFIKNELQFSKNIATICNDF